jgi:hypothetical protein
MSNPTFLPQLIELMQDFILAEEIDIPMRL